jgi:diaminopimelate decarboxylase
MEGVKLQDVAAQFGTPVFAYSKAAMLSALAAYQRGFAGRKAQICYAMKANSNLAVLQVFAQAGCGFDSGRHTRQNYFLGCWQNT